MWGTSVLSFTWFWNEWFRIENNSTVIFWHHSYNNNNNLFRLGLCRGKESDNTHTRPAEKHEWLLLFLLSLVAITSVTWRDLCLTLPSALFSEYVAGRWAWRFSLSLCTRRAKVHNYTCTQFYLRWRHMVAYCFITRDHFYLFTSFFMSIFIWQKSLILGEQCIGMLLRLSYVTV